jgi:hypothetical protein
MVGIGATPRASIFEFDRAENFGRFASVRYWRSLVGLSSGATPAKRKIMRANSNQEMGVPPAT